MSEAEARRQFHALVMGLAVKLEHLVRSSQIYPDDHPALDSALEAVCELVSQAVAGRGTVGFAPVDRRFVINGTAVPAPRAMRTPLQQLQKWLEERGLGGIELRASLGPSSLIRTIRLINDQPGEGRPGPDVVNLQLDEAGLRAIRVTPRRALQADASSEASLEAVRLYLRGIRAVRRMHNRGMSPAVLIELGQIAEGIVELCGSAPGRALVLAEPRRMVPYDGRHAVNVAILAVLLGQRFDLERDALVELATCALCADAGKAGLVPEARIHPSRLSGELRAHHDRHPIEAVRQLLTLPELHDNLRRRLLVAFEQDLGDDLAGSPEVIRWGHRHPFSRIIGLASAWDSLRAGGAGEPTMALSILRQDEAGAHDPLLLDHLEGVLSLGR